MPPLARRGMGAPGPGSGQFSQPRLACHMCGEGWYMRRSVASRVPPVIRDGRGVGTASFIGVVAWLGAGALLRRGRFRDGTGAGRCGLGARRDGVPDRRTGWRLVARWELALRMPSRPSAWQGDVRTREFSPLTGWMKAGSQRRPGDRRGSTAGTSCDR